MNKDNKRKIRAVLETSDNLMVNNNGYLYVKDKLDFYKLDLRLPKFNKHYK